MPFKTDSNDEWIAFSPEPIEFARRWSLARVVAFATSILAVVCLVLLVG